MITLIKISAAFCIFLSAIAGNVVCAQSRKLELKLINSIKFPSNAQNMIFGLSALAYDDAQKILYALSDYSGQKSNSFFGKKDNARLYKFDLSYVIDEKGERFALGENPVRLDFRDEGGFPFDRGRVDLEGMVLLEDGRLVLVSEQDTSKEVFDLHPKIFTFSPDGKRLGLHTFPYRFNNEGTASKGLKRNRAFEGITLMPDFYPKTFAVLSENSLIQDVDSQLLRFSLLQLPDTPQGEVEILEEYAYLKDDLSKEDFYKNDLNFERVSTGVSDLLALDPATFIVIERSHIRHKEGGHLSVVRLYQVDINKGSPHFYDHLLFTDIKGMIAITDAVPKVDPLKKELILDLSTLKDEKGEIIDKYNIEGITQGPTINGQRTLILVQDNGENPEPESNLFLFFKLIEG